MNGRPKQIITDVFPSNLKKININTFANAFIYGRFLFYYLLFSTMPGGLILFNYFILAGILGYIYEYMYHKFITPNDTRPKGYFWLISPNIPFYGPFIEVYSIGFLLLFLIKNFIKEKNLILLSLFSGVILTIYEELLGNFDQFILNEPQQWNYHFGNHFLISSSGYTSFDTTILWCFLSYIYLSIR